MDKSVQINDDITVKIVDSLGSKFTSHLLMFVNVIEKVILKELLLE